MTPFAILLGLSLQAAALPAASPDPCPRGRIADVTVNNHSIFSEADSVSSRRLGWAYRAANTLHTRTRPSVIRREILFAPGDCFDPYRVAESERLLRSFDVLSRVAIIDSVRPDGDHHITIETHDEWSTRVDVRLNARGYAISASEDNLFGMGQSLGVYYVNSDVTRDVGIAYYTPQLLGTRWNMRADVGQTRAGTVIRQEVSYPWVGEVSSWAAVQAFAREDRFFDFITADDPDLDAGHVLLPLRDKVFDLAVVRRFGPPGNTAMLGVALGYQQLSYQGVPLFLPRGDYNQRIPVDSVDRLTIAAQRGTRDNIRAYALFGYRTIQWVRRRGMDSMRGQEDVRLGAEMGLGIGHSAASLERDNDVYTTLSLYTGMEAGNALFVGKFRTDGLRSLSARIDEPEWQDFYGDAELLTYVRPAGSAHHLLFMRASAIGAWNTKTPFQLTLGGERNVRGYDYQRFPGGRRLVFNLEDRIYFGWPYPKALDLGATVFADAGRIWSGDVPYGVDSGWRTSAGIGLRTAFPAGGRTVYRVDLAWPIERGTTARDFRLQLSLGEPIGMNPRMLDPQVMRSRPRGAAGQLFPSAR